MHQGTERRACIGHRHTRIMGFQRIDLHLEARGRPALGRAAVGGWRRRDLRLVVKEVVGELVEHVVEEVVGEFVGSKRAAAPFLKRQLLLDLVQPAVDADDGVTAKVSGTTAPAAV